jgi:hypothetical protein
VSVYENDFFSIKGKHNACIRLHVSLIDYPMMCSLLPLPCDDVRWYYVIKFHSRLRSLSRVGVGLPLFLWL